MMRSYENHVRDVPDVTFGIVGPDGREAMLQHAAEFAERRHPVYLRSGPGDAVFNGDDCARFIEQCAVRHRQRLRIEPAAAQHRMWMRNQIKAPVKAYVVTRGPKGPNHTTTGKPATIPAGTRTRCPIRPVAATLSRRPDLRPDGDLDLSTCGRMASLMGARMVEHPGTQNQRFTFAEFADQFRQQFRVRRWTEPRSPHSTAIRRRRHGRFSLFGTRRASRRKRGARSSAA
jgi:adenosine kinase